MRGVKKTNLPQKTCLACQRSFTWRKKWELVWDEVKYCSERCRRNRSQVPKAKTDAKHKP